MSSEIEKLTEAYLERVKRPKTWSGIPVKEMYTPDDVKSLDYQRDLGNAGDYPFTRGIYPDMYRGRFWTTREVCGFGTPADTNKWLKFQMGEGVGGLNVIFDLPSETGVDSNHPLAAGDVGLGGVAMCSIKDMDEMTEGIPLDKVSFSLISADPVTLAAYIAVAQNRGIHISTLMGTIQNEPLHSRYCAADPSCYPLDLSYKLAIDIIEYCARYVPRWVTGNVNLYNLRETGITAAQEIAFGFAFAIAHIDGALKRGLKIDEFANRRAFYCSAHIDFFEEIAKLRAARRMWAKIMKEKYHAQDPKSWKFRFAVHTAGSSLVYQQPLNNIIRVAYEALAAVLAGAQSLHACSFDEPVALPTKESQRIAVRTQQILAYETGVGNVVDPLGGSYYVESLTNKIEEEATRILEEIEKMGGALEAIRTQWFDREIDAASIRYQKELEGGERIMVGVNAFTVPAEEESPVGAHQIHPESAQLQIDNVKNLKATRDQKKVRLALEQLRQDSGKGESFNLMPAIIEALKAYATRSEILGTIREVYGYPYDPLGIVKSPFATH